MPDVADGNAIGAIVVEAEGLAKVGVAVVTTHVGEEEVQVAVVHRIILDACKIAKCRAQLTFPNLAVGL